MFLNKQNKERGRDRWPGLIGVKRGAKRGKTSDRWRLRCIIDKCLAAGLMPPLSRDYAALVLS